MSKFSKRKLEQSEYEEHEGDIDVSIYVQTPDMIIPRLMKMKEQSMMSSIFKFILETLGLKSYLEEKKQLSLKEVRLIFEHMIRLIKIDKDAGIIEETLKKLESNKNYQEIQLFFTSLLVSDLPIKFDQFLPQLVDLIYIIGNQSVRIIRKGAIELIEMIHFAALSAFKVNSSKFMDQFIYSIYKYLINFRLSDKCVEIQTKARNIVLHVLKTSHPYIKTENYHKVIGVLLNEQNEVLLYTVVDELMLSLQNPQTQDHLVQNTIKILQVNQGQLNVLLFKQNIETQLKGLLIFKQALKQSTSDYYLDDYTRLCLFRQLIAENYKVRYSLADFLEQINPELKKNFPLQSSQELLMKMITFQSKQFYIGNSNNEDTSYKFMSAIIPHFEYSINFQSYLELIKSRQLDDQREYILILSLNSAIKFGQQIENLVAQYQMDQFSQEKINRYQQSQQKLSIIFYENVEILIPLYQSTQELKNAVLLFLSNLKQEKQIVINENHQKLFELIKADLMNNKFQKDQEIKSALNVMRQFANQEGHELLMQLQYQLVDKYCQEQISQYQQVILKNLLRINKFIDDDVFFNALEESKDCSHYNIELIGQYIECLVTKTFKNMNLSIINKVSELLQTINHLIQNYLVLINDTKPINAAKSINAINIFLDSYECIFNDAIVIMNPELIPKGSSFDRDLKKYLLEYLIADAKKDLNNDKCIIINNMINMTNQCQLTISHGQFRSYLYKSLLHLKLQKNDNHIMVVPLINYFDTYIINLLDRDQRTKSTYFNIFFKHAIMYCCDYKRDEVSILQELASHFIKIIKQALQVQRYDVVSYQVANLIKELLNVQDTKVIQTKCHLFINEALGSYMYLIKQLRLNINYFNQFEKFINCDSVQFYNTRITQEFMKDPRNKIHIQVQQELRTRLKKILDYLQKHPESKKKQTKAVQQRNNNYQQQSQRTSVQKSQISRQSQISQQGNQMEVEEEEHQIVQAEEPNYPEQENQVPDNDEHSATDIEFFTSDSDEN